MIFRIPAFAAALVLSAPVWAGLLVSLPARAEATVLYEKSAKLPADTAYQRLYDGLEARGYYVLFEPDMGKSLAGMKDRLGADYNRNALETMRSLVFCNPVKTNALSNLDPALLALCPLHLTLTHKGGVSTAYFARVTRVAETGPAAGFVRELEADIVGVIEGALDAE